jgi:membrane-associated protein
MDVVTTLFELFLHFDEYLAEIIAQYGVWTYALLFLVIFLETGVVVTPFLPGDSLLFAAGSFAALDVLNPWILVIVLSVAAIIGDTVNYWIGHYVGPRAFSGNVRFLKKEYMDRTHDFYERHGGKTIILARFVPIVRTFAPFVAGVGAMTYPKFITYNVVGGIVWVMLFVWLGYFFGNLPFVQTHFEAAILAIIFISVLPIIFEFVKGKLRSRKESAEAEA